MSLEKYTEYAELSNAAVAHGKQHWGEVLKGAFLLTKQELPSLDALMIRGYTPGFNDGEPCTFNLEITAAELSDYIDEDFVSSYFNTFHGKSEEDFEDFDEYYDYVIENLNGDINWRTEEPVISKVFAPLNELIERTFDTDGFVVYMVLRDDGEIEYTVESYDCGY